MYFKIPTHEQLVCFQEELYNPRISDKSLKSTCEEIEEEIADILRYCRVYDYEEYIYIYELSCVAYDFLYATIGNDNFVKDERANNLARLLIKQLVNSMYINRSFEINSSAKTSIVTKNILAKLSVFELDGEDSDTN